MISTKDKIKMFQTALGSYADGIAGASTWDAGMRFLDAEGYLDIEFPYEVYQWGCKVMFTKPNRVVVLNGEGKYDVGDFKYSISGSFTSPSGVKPCSILVNDGKVIRRESCHYPTWDGRKPETVIWRKNDGELGMSLIHLADELPSDIDWAIGGGQIVKDGVAEFNEVAEGFTGRFSDVFRSTAHCAVGFDKFGNVLGVYHKSCTLRDFQRRCVSIGMVNGIFVDGGHISAINAGGLIANINQKQGYIIQF